MSGNGKLLAEPDTLRLASVADSLFASGEFRQAGIYYQKAAFFHNGTENKTALTIKAAQSYKLMHRYGDAIDILSSINLDNLSDQDIYTVKYQSALLAYLSGDFSLSESFLVQLAYLVKDTGLVTGSNLLYALVLNESYRWTDALGKLNQMNIYVNNLKPEQQRAYAERLDSMYNVGSRPVIKNVQKAMKLSTFFPGSGQAYAGYWGEGLFSLAAMLTVTTGMVAGVISQYYFTSVFLGNILIGKFYQGGVKRTEFLAEKRNYLNTRKYNDGLKKELLKMYGN